MKPITSLVLRAATVGLVLNVSFATTSVAESPSVAEVLARVNDALGWQRVAAHPGAVRVRGAARLLGTDATQVELFDGRGRWLQTFEGPLPGASGSDGETAWTVDWTGTPRVLELGDLRDSDMTTALLHGSWAAAESPLEVTSVTEAEGRLELAFHVEGGTSDGSVELDAETWLPTSASWRRGDTVSTWSFAEFRDHEGYRFPARLTMETSGLTQSLATQQVEFLEEVDTALFAPRLGRPQDTRFDSTVDPELEVKQVASGHLLVHPTVEGKDLGWFIFDSGAGSNCISTSVAERLEEGSFGAIPAQGIGGTVQANFWRAADLELGPLTVDDPIFVGLDLDFLSGYFGVEVGGILGYELLSRCAAEFDQSEPRIALFDPETYSLAEGGTWREVALFDRHPCVRATFEGHTGLFKVDTGAAGDTVTMHAPVVRELKLLEGRETTAGRAGGVGGVIEVRDGELKSFELGGREFGPIQASFAVEEKGVFANPHVWGNLGGLLFEPFMLVFDYPNRRLGFLPK